MANKVKVWAFVDLSVLVMMLETTGSLEVGACMTMMWRPAKASEIISYKGIACDKLGS